MMRKPSSSDQYPVNDDGIARILRIRTRSKDGNKFYYIKSGTTHNGSGLFWRPEKTIKFILNDLIALAGCLFQRLPVQYADNAAAIGDQPGMFQLRSHFIDAGAPDAQHHPQKFLCQKKPLRLHAIMCHQ